MRKSGSVVLRIVSGGAVLFFMGHVWVSIKNVPSAFSVEAWDKVGIL